MTKRKPKTLIGALFEFSFGTFDLLNKASKSYKPYNSKGRKISRAKKRKLF